MLRIGYHVSIAGSIDLAFDRASMINCTAMQIFLSNPRGWASMEINSSEEKSFIEKSEKFDIDPVIVHMPYLPNLASSNKTIYEKSVDSLRSNIVNCNLLGIKYLVLHLGSHMGAGKELGLENVVNALQKVEKHIGDLNVLLENEVGHANSVGSRIEDLKYIYDNSKIKNIGFCLDTCHLFASGYDIREKKVLDNIEKELGWSKVHVLHLNDAKHELGSNLDRHENIGYGHIGREGFEKFLSYYQVKKKPMILETPYRDGLNEGYELKSVIGICNSIREH